MKKIATFVFLILTLSLTLLHADSIETYFKFKADSRQQLDELTKIISIDNVKDGFVYVYANESLP